MKRLICFLRRRHDWGPWTEGTASTIAIGPFCATNVETKPAWFHRCALCGLREGTTEPPAIVSEIDSLEQRVIVGVDYGSSAGDCGTMVQGHVDCDGVFHIDSIDHWRGHWGKE